jgi:hypothetical protein
MKQIPPTKNIYHVCVNEKVTLTFTPFAGADPSMLAISHANTPDENGHALTPDPNFPDTPTFHFTVSQPVGDSESVEYVCSFSGDVTNNTRFELVLKGSKGEGKELKGPTVRATSNVKLIDLAFRVRASC